MTPLAGDDTRRWPPFRGDTGAMPILFGAAPRDLKPPPMHGEHSRAVLRERGYTDAESTLIANAGVIVDGTS